MRAVPDHLSDEQIFSVIDGNANATERSNFNDHLAACTACRARFDSTMKFERIISRMPLATVGPWFAESVLQKAGVKPLRRSSIRMIEFGAGIFGLFGLAAVTIAILAVLGFFEPLPALESSGVSSPVFGPVGAGINTASAELGRTLKEFFPFLFGAGSVWSSFSVLVAVLLLLILEPVVGKRLVQKGR